MWCSPFVPAMDRGVGYWVLVEGASPAYGPLYLQGRPGGGTGEAGVGGETNARRIGSGLNEREAGRGEGKTGPGTKNKEVCVKVAERVSDKV